jgi:hypothetical protein
MHMLISSRKRPPLQPLKYSLGAAPRPLAPYCDRYQKSVSRRGVMSG